MTKSAPDGSVSIVPDEVEDEWPQTIVLHKPLESQTDGTVTELVLQEPTLHRLRAIQGATGDIDKAIKLISRLSGHSEKVIGELGPRDQAKLGDLLSDFFT